MSDRATASFDYPTTTSLPMKCAACSERACAAMQKVPGVFHVDCNATGGTVVIEFDASRLSESDLLIEMERFGLEHAETIRHAAWRVIGLD